MIIFLPLLFTLRSQMIAMAAQLNGLLYLTTRLNFDLTVNAKFDNQFYCAPLKMKYSYKYSVTVLD